MLHANETKIELTTGMKRKVRNYAHFGGGIYRMNTEGARYYSFTPYQTDKGKQDFTGGFDWFSTLPNNFEFVYDMEHGRFYTMEKWTQVFKSK